MNNCFRGITASFLLLASCGDNDASSGVTDTVRSTLPLYYDINDVQAASSKQTFQGQTVDIAQLAIEVTLKEDLFVETQLSEELQKKLAGTSPTRFGMGSSFRSDRKFLKKVASQGETKTLYGELVTSDLPDGKVNVEGFQLKDAKGLPMSSFNKSEVIVVGSQEETDYVDSILKKQAEATKIEEEKKKEAAELKLKEQQAEKDRLASITAQHEQELEKERAEILSVFKEGESYQGVYLARSGEEVLVTVKKFNSQFLHGSLQVSKTGTDYKFDIDFSFKAGKTSGGAPASYRMTGSNPRAAKPSKSVLKSSSMATAARFANSFRISGYEISPDSVKIKFRDSELAMSR